MSERHDADGAVTFGRMNSDNASVKPNKWKNLPYVNHKFL